MQPRSVLIRAALILAAAFALFPLLNRGVAPSGTVAADEPPARERRITPGGFDDRATADRRERAVMEGGGNFASEAAVAAGLKWLALHQCEDGHWSLDKFPSCARENLTDTKRTPCKCEGAGGMANDTAATALALLPFLGAGTTHKRDFKARVDYSKTVDSGLKWLMKQQQKDGDFNGGMYAQGLTTIAVCEAYALTRDDAFKRSAQKAIDYIVAAQDPDKHGWRYAPRGGSDTCVTGWQVMALKSGEMAGLKVPSATFAGADKWLDECEGGKVGEEDFGYGYVGKVATPTMTAVGLLCRQYMGWGPRKPQMISGVANLSKRTPGTADELQSMYFNYYATQVMHHMGGDSWKNWNAKMRDKLIKEQDRGRTDKHEHQIGSWSPEGDPFAGAGGRIMRTSLSLLTLEVYYRHVPLYRTDKGD